MIKSEDFGKRFAIHASREIDERVYRRIAEIAPDLLTIDASTNVRTVPCLRDWYRLSRDTSAVIAVATLADAMYIGGCNPTAIVEAVSRAGLDVEEQFRWTFGPTVYVLRDVIALPTPVPCRGWQGFWTVSGDVEQAIEKQLAARAA